LDDVANIQGPRATPLAGGPVDGAVPELEHTGERFLPGTRGSAEIAYDHIARYRLAERYVEGKITVDLGCGAGYGTYSLSKFTTDILGVDLSREAVAYADWSYGVPGLRYEVGDVTNLPYEAGSFEAAVSFEVIEHLERPEALVEEVRRLLREDGIFVTSTPDKQTYSNDRNSVNPHHLKEMYPLEFRELLERHFEHVQLYRQGALAGSIITPDGEELPEDGQVTLESTQFSLPDPPFGREVPTTLYMIAVCTNGEAPEPLHQPLLILDRDRQIYEEHAQWQAMLGQLMAYQNHRYRVLSERTQQQSKRVRQLQGEARQLQNEINLIKNSRSWRLARRISATATGVRRVLRRG